MLCSTSTNLISSRRRTGRSNKRGLSSGRIGYVASISMGMRIAKEMTGTTWSYPTGAPRQWLRTRGQMGPTTQPGGRRTAEWNYSLSSGDIPRLMIGQRKRRGDTRASNFAQPSTDFPQSCCRNRIDDANEKPYLHARLSSRRRLETLRLSSKEGASAVKLLRPQCFCGLLRIELSYLFATEPPLFPLWRVFQLVFQRQAIVKRVDTIPA